MRAKSHELKGIRVRFTVDQNKVGLDVAVPMVIPITCESMVAMVLG
ncbi:hypothetical protein TVNIR_0624 [Thioalkalivibrio nitratireducens DSM 14787]|uniref:Uncharacterized protein n=1 Tax=Thioalkalivibrio nitratireducens (strain DSM 14787 / UNIQEM 213 / ALEN2) TaxID=1255043 RepID=L0DRW0_THIND|nr:hypothetical protein TVNIR_0624 [Thioalkalivibrio nitratireducens DSM 14787]